jgi:hypothetical protein
MYSIREVHSKTSQEGRARVRSEYGENTLLKKFKKIKTDFGS